MKFAHVVDYIYLTLISTLSQFLVLFGPILLLALIMNIISRHSEKIGCKALGVNTYLYIFKWLGTTVHETGHALFAIIFGHKITEIVLFSPKSQNGSFGHVAHTYNRKNIYQNIGNFFIGIGPVISGSLILLLITWILFGFNLFNTQNTHPINLSAGVFPDFHILKTIALNTWDNLLSYLQRILRNSHNAWWKIVLLVYFLYSVGSSVTLSPSDAKGAAKGLLYTVAILLIFNLFTIWIGDFAISFFTHVNNSLSQLYFLLLLTMAINIVFILILHSIILLKSIFTP